MGTITAIKDTIFKAENVDANELEKNELVNIPAKSKLAIASVTDDSNQHVKVKFLEPLKTLEGTEINEGYLYEPHWEIPLEVLPREVKLGVIYRNQIDNSTNLFGTGHRQCNLTANAMALDYLLGRFGQKTLAQMAQEGGFREAESVYAKTLKKYGDTIYHDAHTKALKEFEVESYFSLTMSLADLIHCLSCHMPVPVSVDYKSSGHIILIVGYDPEKKFFWVHDPYGSRAGASHSYAVRGGNAGAYDRYSLQTMEQIWDGAKGRDRGWGRVFTSVAEQPTGCKFGL